MPDEDAPQRIGQERKRKRGNTNSQERRNEEEGVGKREKGNRHNGNGGRGPRLLDEARRSRASFGRKANHDASLLAAGWCSSSTSLLSRDLPQARGRKKLLLEAWSIAPSSRTTSRVWQTDGSGPCARPTARDLSLKRHPPSPSLLLCFASLASHPLLLCYRAKHFSVLQNGPLG